MRCKNIIVEKIIVVHPKIIFENLGQTRERCISFLTFMKCLINAGDLS